ncbi:permease prefix domain 1-containing protein [Leifsonia sp. McL0607]|uniref:permease prefix domain 1-containing protein n=1 Tax=Leifsonia sp. McL0607 TaxID=3415672 RepID=UPI003CE7A859
MSRIPDARLGLPQPNDAIEDYMAELNSYLRGPARLRARVAEEIAVDLESAVREFRRHGLGAPEAARAAVAELGSAKSVAAGFVDELAIAEARAVLRWLLATGPLVGLWWLLLLAPAGWVSHPGELLTAIPILPVVAIAVAAGLLVLATTGSLIRWLPETSSRRAVSAAVLVGLVCIAGDLLVLTTLTVRLATGSGSSFTAGLVVVAVTASLIRLPSAIWATSRCLRTRHLLSTPLVLTR